VSDRRAEVELDPDSPRFDRDRGPPPSQIRRTATPLSVAAGVSPAARPASRRRPRPNSGWGSVSSRVVESGIESCRGVRCRVVFGW